MMAMISPALESITESISTLKVEREIGRGRPSQLTLHVYLILSLIITIIFFGLRTISFELENKKELIQLFINTSHILINELMNLLSIQTLSLSLLSNLFGTNMSKFANRAKNIKNEARINEDLDQKSLLRKYMQTVLYTCVCVIVSLVELQQTLSKLSKFLFKK
jgi:hypothetical protein